MLLYGIILLFTLFYVYQLRKRSKLPPGPLPIHLFGNLPQIGFYVWREGTLPKALKRIKKEYGDLFTLWMGPAATVHIGSMELAHELMVKQGNSFADRWAPLLFRYINKGLGISMSNGNYWVEQRRFALHTLRNFGLGRNLIEERIMMEFDLSKPINGDEVDIKRFCDLMIGNIMNRILFGERFTQESEKEFFILKKSLEESMERVGFLDIYVQEWMLKIPVMKSYYDNILRPVQMQRDFLDRKISERLEAIKQGDHAITGEGTDFVDAYLKKMEIEKDERNSPFTRESLNMTLMDMWSAGQESTTTILLWAFIYFLNYPDKAAKAREEIHGATHQSRSLSLKDRTETPFYNATILEILRQASLVTLNLFRSPSNTATVGPYIIERDIPITAQISLIMSEDKDFEVTDFYPERFLETPKLEQKVVPFGIGKRACPGESLARAELYLIIGNILAEYNLEAVGELPSLDSTNGSGLVRKPNEYNLKLIPIIPLN